MSPAAMDFIDQQQPIFPSTSSLLDPRRQGGMVSITSLHTGASTPFFNSDSNFDQWKTPDNNSGAANRNNGGGEMLAHSASSVGSGGNHSHPVVRYGPGRLTVNRTPTIEKVSRIPPS